jgi:hypothetical protein
MVSKGGKSTLYFANTLTGPADAGYLVGLPGHTRVASENTYEGNIFSGFSHSRDGGDYVLADSSRNNTIVAGPAGPAGPADPPVDAVGNVRDNRVLSRK